MLVALLVPRPAAPHHSEAPHFIQNQNIELTGTVDRWQNTNPHAVLHLWVGEGRDRVLWRCEANSATAIRRLGVTAATFKPGDRVTLQAMPGRREKNLCNIKEARLPDGRVVNFRLQALPPAADSLPANVAANSSIYGVWSAVPNPARGAAPPPAALPGSTTSIGVWSGPAWLNRLNAMTPEGKKATAAYDAYRDDPVHRCSAVSPVRVWGAGPFSLTRDGNDRIILQHEWMDARRVIYLNQKVHPANAPRTTLGHSIGRWEGDTLVVDTARYLPGVIYQYVVDADAKLTGLLHSDAYRVVERIRFNPSTRQLEIEYTQSDPKYHTAALPTGSLRFRTAAVPLEKWNCRPDGSG
jgi:hypothetical protein